MIKYEATVKSVCGLGLFACVIITQSATATSITAYAGMMLDDNITRAQYGRDIYDDRALLAGINLGFSMPIDQRSRAAFTAVAETWQYQNANLGHEIISLQADYVFQPDKGYSAPWYSVYFQYGLNLHDNSYRDGSFNELGLTLGKRLTDATNLRAGISRQQTATDDQYFIQNSASVYSNFSQTILRIYANLDFKFAENTAYTTLAYSTGDILSTSTFPHPNSVINLPWKNEDTVFPGLTNSWTYKIDADTWSLRLGYVYAISSNQSLDANILRYDSAAYGGNNYDGMITSITYFYRF